MARTVEEQKAARRAWRIANADKIKAYNAANRERALAYQRAYNRQWRATHVDEAQVAMKAWRQAWRLAHPDQKRHDYEAIKVWRAANPERRRRSLALSSARRRTRKSGAFVEVVDPFAVYVRDGGVCQICDRFIGDAKWEIDHRIPLARGGLHSYANSQLAHAHCNRVKAWSL